MNQRENFTKGILKENQVLVALLALCPTLAITTSLENALGMGIAVTVVLTFSNLFISLIRKIVPDQVRIPVFIVIIATFVTIIDMVMAAFLPSVHASLGIFIPLITVNCIILGRAEAFASKNDPLSSVIDGLGMAIGFTIVISIISIIREILGAGQITVWGDVVLNLNSLFGVKDGIASAFSNFFLQPVGAFIVFGLLLGIFTTVKNKKQAKAEVKN